MRTLLIALAVLPLAVPLSACSDDEREGEAKRPTRIVCTEAGRIVHDDFAAANETPQPTKGFMYYTSETQQGTVRISGTCTSYPAVKPAGWKPVIPGL